MCHKNGVLTKFNPPSPLAFGEVAQKPGGLNGSTQHPAKTHIH